MVIVVVAVVDEKDVVELETIIKFCDGSLELNQEIGFHQEARVILGTIKETNKMIKTNLDIFFIDIMVVDILCFVK